MPPSYERALCTAMDAAARAGELLRSEFHRPGGPRGTGGHAPVDDEAEALIRGRLRSAFPDWAYLGEETGTDGPAEAAHRWLVDPNDGTVSFVKRRRGTAVSIGLVRNGVPVLGVVYAPVAPDDSGDLIAWAEGMPLTRNGRPVDRTLPVTLGPRDLVLLSGGADRNAAANARCLAPARFRAMPSIAYRLALVAVGEGEATASLSGPVAWDFGGGHALLRAVGGELVDESGRPITYAANGQAVSRRVFGASLPAGQALAARNWGAVFEALPSDPLSARFPRRAAPSTRVRDAGLLSRAQGCLLGQVAGDALGGQVEFSPAASIRARYPDGLRELEDGGHWGTLAGQPTDDSELALLLARTMARDGGFDAQAVREVYRAWMASEPFDIGGTTSAGLQGRHDLDSQANGGLMRVSPLGVWGHRLSPAELGALARAESAITHPNAVCADASAAFAVAIAHAVRTGAGAASAHGVALAWARGAKASAPVVHALAAAASEPPAEYSRHMGWVLIALQNAFHRALHAPSVEEGVVQTVMAGGDTDTNGAVAGALLGAIHGRGAVPPRWRRLILSCRALPGTGRPRPRCLWPVDIEELAEALLRP
ncbi:MAG TPA: inositol monophosphatase family protein [Gemmatimonadales bacterium]|nr:inositol monophosphatase family protein [Gemmatimonadales bacterium]